MVNKQILIKNLKSLTELNYANLTRENENLKKKTESMTEESKKHRAVADNLVEENERYKVECDQLIKLIESFQLEITGVTIRCLIAIFRF